MQGGLLKPLPEYNKVGRCLPPDICGDFGGFRASCTRENLVSLQTYGEWRLRPGSESVDLAKYPGR